MLTSLTGSILVAIAEAREEGQSEKGVGAASAFVPRSETSSYQPYS